MPGIQISEQTGWNAKPAKAAKKNLQEFFACFAGFAFNVVFAKAVPYGF